MDKSAPNAPSVTSPQYPGGKAGDWAEGAKYGTTGEFTLGANGSNDTVEYAYSFDTTSFVNRIKPLDAGGAAIVRFIPTHAGPNVLYVKAKDATGNLSTQTAYTFFVEPRDTVDGRMDLTGDQRPDLPAIDGAGNLRVFPSFSGGRLGQSLDGADLVGGAVPAGYWKNALITHHGDYWGGDGFQDLIARMPDGRLWVYPGSGRGGVDVAKRMELSLPSGSPASATFTRILSVGDITGDGHPDLFAIAGADLWFFDGYTGAAMSGARKVKVVATRCSP